MPVRRRRFAPQWPQPWCTASWSCPRPRRWRPHLGAHPRPGHRHPTPRLPTTRRCHPTDPPV